MILCYLVSSLVASDQFSTRWCLLYELSTDKTTELIEFAIAIILQKSFFCEHIQDDEYQIQSVFLCLLVIFKLNLYKWTDEIG